MEVYMMKKTLVLVMCIVLTLSAVLVGCGDKAPATLKFGVGVYSSTPAVTDATADKDGSGKIDVTVAAVSVDADGKIVACALDTASNTVNFTADGKAIAKTEFKTKYELGKDYNMVAYGGAKKEWFEQADAFETLVAGKTLAEVKALVAAENKGNDEVIAAGCTIMIHEFVAAIEKAYNAAADSNVTAESTLKVTAATEQVCTDATADKDGSNKVSVYVFGAAVDADGKVVAANSDCVEVAFSFSTAGASTLDTGKAIVSKKDQGDNYGMVAYGGAKNEWYAQAAAFDAACIGKTATEISALMGSDGKGVADLQTAGCTIYVSGFVKAASKI
jgi:ethanolamine utilization protein EutP (predicted NTPase)